MQIKETSYIVTQKPPTPVQRPLSQPPRFEDTVYNDDVQISPIQKKNRQSSQKRNKFTTNEDETEDQRLAKFDFS